MCHFYKKQSFLYYISLKVIEKEKKLNSFNIYPEGENSVIKIVKYISIPETKT